MIRLKALSRMEISTDLNQIDTQKSTYSWMNLRVKQAPVQTAANVYPQPHESFIVNVPHTTQYWSVVKAWHLSSQCNIGQEVYI